MRTTIIAIALGLSTAAKAATCNLVVNGESLWHGHCYVKMNTDGGGLRASAHTDHCHANGGPDKCTAAEACAGPWLNVFSETDGTYSSYWSIEGACHGGDAVNNITQTGAGTYRGENYSFTVKSPFLGRRFGAVTGTRL
jgi:hypothetical protein